MRIIHRLIWKIAPGKWDEVMPWQRRWEAVETPYGVPPFKWMRLWSGSADNADLVGEQEWDSLAQMEACYAKAQADPARRALENDPEFHAIFLSGRHEFYGTLE